MQRVLSTRFPTLVIHPPREVRTPDNARNKDEVLKEVRGLFKDETRRVNQVGINQALHLSRIPFSLRTFPLYYESARQGTYQYRTLRKHTPNHHGITVYPRLLSDSMPLYSLCLSENFAFSFPKMLVLFFFLSAAEALAGLSAALLLPAVDFAGVLDAVVVLSVVAEPTPLVTRGAI
jgi:hypothetical protein